MDELLYHYTSIDRFAQILKNRTIRLSPLDKMDDLQENITKDIKNIGRFFFASCWTAEEEESIPMWNMYTDIKAGIRIGLHDRTEKKPMVRFGAMYRSNADRLYRKHRTNARCAGRRYQDLPVSESSLRLQTAA